MSRDRSAGSGNPTGRFLPGASKLDRRGPGSSGPRKGICGRRSSAGEPGDRGPGLHRHGDAARSPGRLPAGAGGPARRGHPRSRQPGDGDRGTGGRGLCRRDPDRAHHHNPHRPGPERGNRGAGHQPGRRGPETFRDPHRRHHLRARPDRAAEDPQPETLRGCHRPAHGGFRNRPGGHWQDLPAWRRRCRPCSPNR